MTVLNPTGFVLDEELGNIETYHLGGNKSNPLYACGPRSSHHQQRKASWQPRLFRQGLRGERQAQTIVKVSICTVWHRGGVQR